MAWKGKRSNSSSIRARAIRAGYRSGLEERIAKELKEANIEFEYEPKDDKILYVQPQTPRKYTPDFPIITRGTGKKIYIETKGLFTSDDRKKHLWIKDQHPDIDLRFVFSGNAEKKYLTKAKASSYADWCNKNCFKYASKSIPEEWLNE